MPSLVSMHHTIESLESRRLLAAGALDLTFSDDGTASEVTNQGGLVINDTAVQPGGRVLVAGYSTRVGGGSTALLLRFNADGTRDTRFFGMATVAERTVNPSFTQVNQILVLSDGRILVRSTEGEIYALTASGKIDGSFGRRGRLLRILPANFGVLDMAAQADGKVLLLGRVPNGRNTAVVRLTSDGQLDPTFGDGGLFVSDLGFGQDTPADFIDLEEPQALVVSSSGDVLVGGTFSRRHNFSASSDDFLHPFVARIDTVGELDESLDGDGVLELFSSQLNGFSRGLVALSSASDDGFVFTTATTSNREVRRFGADGSADTTFAGDGTLEIPFDNDFTIHHVAQVDGKLLFASGGTLLRFNADGTPDETFGTNGVTADPDGFLELGPDGSILQITQTSRPASNRPSVAEHLVNITRRWSEEGPAGLAVAGDITAPLAHSHRFRIEWRDDDAVATSSLASALYVRVTAPDGTQWRAYPQRITPAGDAPILTAVYKVAAPGDSWDASDNGLYTIEVLDGIVKDINGAATIGRTLGRFRIQIS